MGIDRIVALMNAGRDVNEAYPACSENGLGEPHPLSDRLGGVGKWPSWVCRLATNADEAATRSTVTPTPSSSRTRRPMARACFRASQAASQHADQWARRWDV